MNNKKDEYYSKRHELLSKYLRICDELWQLNQAYVRQNIDYMEFENSMYRNRPENNEDVDLPF